MTILDYFTSTKTEIKEESLSEYNIQAARIYSKISNIKAASELIKIYPVAFLTIAKYTFPLSPKNMATENKKCERVTFTILRSVIYATSVFFTAIVGKK